MISNSANQVQRELLINSVYSLIWKALFDNVTLWKRYTHTGWIQLCQAAQLRALTTDAAGQLNVLGHDGHTLGVDGAQVGILEQTNQVCLSSLLQCKHSRALEAQVGLEILGDLADQALERQLADEQLSGLLVLADLTQSNSARSVAVGLLDAASCGRGLHTF